MSQRAHGELLLEQLRQQRETDFLCDITITVGDLPFRAHRNVLAAFSQFFSCMSDSTQQNTTLNPDLVSQHALEKLLEFVYTGEMSINSKTSEVVRRAAVFLGMSAVERYMDQTLRLSRSEFSNQSEAGIESEPTSPTILPSAPSPPSLEDSSSSVSFLGVNEEGKMGGDEEMEREEIAEENMEDPEYIPTNPITQSTLQRGQGRKRIQKTQTSTGHMTTMSSAPDAIADSTTQRGRGRVRGRGRGGGRVEVKREELSFVDSDLQAIKMGRDISSDRSPSPPAKQMRGSGGEGRGRRKPKGNRQSDEEWDEDEEEEGKSKLAKQQPTCKECKRVFSQDSSLRRHMRIHKGLKPFHCPICPKHFRQGSQLKIHLRIHTGEKPFACTQCDKSFVQKCQLVSHCRMYHGEEKPYRCEDCGLQFATSTNFKIHSRLHSGERPYVCEDCGKAFAQISTLIYHRRRHTGEKPYQCDKCGMSFSVSSSLIAHSRKHTGETPHACSHCDKRFSSVSERNKHLRSHNKEGIVPCEICGNSFISIRNMLRHQQRAHAGQRPEAVPDASSHLKIPIDHQGLISRLALTRPVPGHLHTPDPDNPDKCDASTPNPNLHLSNHINLVIPKPDPDAGEPDPHLNPDLDNETIAQAGINPDTLRALVEQLRSSSPGDTVEQIIIIQTQ